MEREREKRREIHLNTLLHLFFIYLWSLSFSSLLFSSLRLFLFSLFTCNELHIGSELRENRFDILRDLGKGRMTANDVILSHSKLWRRGLYLLVSAGPTATNIDKRQLVLVLGRRHQCE